MRPESVQHWVKGNPSGLVHNRHFFWTNEHLLTELLRSGEVKEYLYEEDKYLVTSAVEKTSSGGDDGSDGEYQEGAFSYLDSPEAYADYSSSSESEEEEDDNFVRQNAADDSFVKVPSLYYIYIYIYTNFHVTCARAQKMVEKNRRATAAARRDAAVADFDEQEAQRSRAKAKAAKGAPKAAAAAAAASKHPTAAEISSAAFDQIKPRLGKFGWVRIPNNLRNRPPVVRNPPNAFTHRIICAE